MYEHCAKIDKNDDSAGKRKSEEASDKKNNDFAGKKKSEEASGKKNEGDSSGKLSLNFSKTFNVETVIKSFKQNFVPRTENGLQDNYLTTFSSNNWNKLRLKRLPTHCLTAKHVLSTLQKSKNRSL